MDTQAAPGLKPPRTLLVWKQEIQPRSQGADRARVPRAVQDRLIESFSLFRVNEKKLREAYERRDLLGAAQAIEVGLAEESLWHAIQAMILLQVEEAGRKASSDLRHLLRTPTIGHSLTKQYELLGKKFNPLNWIKNQDVFESWLDRKGIPYEHRLGYTRVTVPDRDLTTDPGGLIYDEAVTIRFADHAEAVGGGFNVATRERYGESQFSVDPVSGHTIKDSEDFIAGRLQGLKYDTKTKNWVTGEAVKLPGKKPISPLLSDKWLRPVAEVTRPKPAAIIGQFNLVNERSVEYARQRSAALVSGIGADTKKAIQDLVIRSFREGRTGDQLARDVREIIGLLPRQATALENFRRRLEQAGRTPAKIEDLTEGYRRRLLLQRSRMIARTEIINSSTQGQQTVWGQAVEQNLIGPKTKRKWIVAPDDRLCSRCEEMRGKTAVLGQPYDNGVMGPTLHPGCRCAEVLTEIDRMDQPA